MRKLINTSEMFELDINHKALDFMDNLFPKYEVGDIVWIRLGKDGFCLTQITKVETKIYLKSTGDDFELEELPPEPNRTSPEWEKWNEKCVEIEMANAQKEPLIEIKAVKAKRAVSSRIYYTQINGREIELDIAFKGDFEEHNGKYNNVIICNVQQTEDFFLSNSFITKTLKANKINPVLNTKV